MRKIRVMATIILLIMILAITLPIVPKGDDVQNKDILLFSNESQDLDAVIKSTFQTETTSYDKNNPAQSFTGQGTQTRSFPVYYGPSVIKLEANTNISGLTFQLQKNSTVLDASVTIKGLPRFDYRTWNPVKVITTDGFDGESEAPAIDLDSSDTLWLAWMDKGRMVTQDTDWDIFYTKDRGNTWEPFNIISTAKEEASRWPDIAIDGTDEIHVVWVDYANIDSNDNDPDIFYRQVKPSSDEMTATKVISKEMGYGTSFNPKVAINDTQDVFVVWQDNGNYIRNNSEYSDIFCRIRYHQNQTWSSIINLSDSTHNGNSTNPEIACDGENVHVVWTLEGDYSGSGSDNDIYYRTWDGYKWNNPRLISNNISDGESNNASVYARDGKICIVWDDNGDIDNSDTDFDIILEKFDNDAWSGPTVISDHEHNGNSTNPQVVIDVDANIHVVWVEDGKIDEDNLDTDIIYRQYESAIGGWSEFVVISDLQTDRESTEPQLSVKNNGWIEVVWMDKGDIDESGTDSDIIYRSTKPYYPTNLKLKVGQPNGDDFDYTIQSSLTDETKLNQSWFRNKLNSLIANMTVPIENYYLILNSDKIGCVEIKDFTLILTTTPSAPSGLQLIDEEPTHVVSHNPYFTWNFMDNDSITQQGFKIEVGTSPGSNNMWNYGPIISEKEMVEYMGKQLMDKQTYFFRVKVMDADGAWSKWSENFQFTMNSKPYMIYLSPDAGTFDEYIDIEWLGVDPDGDKLNYTLQVYYNGSDHTKIKNKPLKQYRLDITGFDSFQTLRIRVKCSDGFEESEGWYYSEEWIIILHNYPPSVKILAPDKDGDVANEYFRIEWESSDPDLKDELIVDLYYDDNKEFSFKEKIESDLLDTGYYIWNTANIPQGQYYICIEITDGKSSNYTYSDGKLEIDHDKNTNPPHVIKTVPAADEHDVKLNQEIRVTFSKPMDKNTLSLEYIILKDSQDNIVKGTIIYEDSRFELIFIPTKGNLEPTQIYTVILKCNIQDIDGKFLDGNRDYFSSNTAEDDYIWSFFTIPASEDTIPPYILSVSPEDLKSEITVRPYIFAVFSEELELASLTPSPVYVYDEFGNIVNIESIFIPGENKLRIDIYGELDHGTRYTVLITAEVRDKVGHGLDGNKNGISEGSQIDNYQWSFKTEEARDEPIDSVSDNGLDTSLIYSIGMLLIIIIVISATILIRKQIRRHKFNIHDIFVVYNDGRLLAHQSFESISNIEESAMGGMLTAIQNFVLESFKNNDSEKLEEIKYGNLKIILTHGKHVYLAVVCTGELPIKNFNRDLSILVNLIELKFSKVLKDWDGNMKKVREINELIRF